MLAVGSLVGPRSDDVVGVSTDVAAGSEVVRAASLGTPTGVRELLSETTTTLVEATGATTTTTTAAPLAAAPTTSPTTEAADAEPDEAVATTTTAAPTARALTTEPRPEPEPEATTTTAAPRREAPTTTAAPRPAPTTTAAPTTTTTAPPSTSGGYAYDDPRSTQVWYDLAQCESGGNWSIDSGNGYYGGLQFSLGSWESVGGSGYPHEHPAATQIQHGRTLQARQGWGAWPHCSEKLGLR